MKLRYIHHSDFRKSEVTLYEEAKKASGGLDLGWDDCVLLVSGNGKILRFVYQPSDQPTQMKSPRGAKKTKVVQSETYRIVGGGTWNPLMLANYANDCGVELEGIRKFETYFKELKESRSTNDTPRKRKS